MGGPEAETSFQTGMSQDFLQGLDIRLQAYPRQDIPTFDLQTQLRNMLGAQCINAITAINRFVMRGDTPILAGVKKGRTLRSNKPSRVFDHDAAGVFALICYEYCVVKGYSGLAKHSTVDIQAVVSTVYQQLEGEDTLRLQLTSYMEDGDKNHDLDIAVL